MSPAPEQNHVSPPKQRQPAEKRPSPLVRSLYDFSFRGHRLTLFLIIFDALAFGAIWLGCYWLRASINPWFPDPINPARYYFKALLIVVPIWLAVSAGWGLYAHRERLSSLGQMRELLGAAKDGVLGSFAVAFLLREISLGRSVVLGASVLNFLWLWATRSALRAIRRRALLNGIGLRRTLIVGTGETARRVARRVLEHPEIGYDLIGTADSKSLCSEGEAEQGSNGFPKTKSGSTVPSLGDATDLAQIIDDHSIHEVFIADPGIPDGAVLNLIARCGDRRVAFKICSTMMDVITDRVKIDDMADLPVIPFQQGSPAQWQAALKRLFDLAVAGTFFLLALLPMLLIALIIRLTSKGPALFTQERVGQDGEHFTLFKFRTMSLDTPTYAPAPGDPRDPRITWIGRILRKTSLDELPQLWNVLRGEMSMVGPRPEMPFLVEKYDEWERQRLMVKPGITGLWQVIGRKNLPLEQHLHYDFYYIKNQSLGLDLLIIIRTIPAVIFGRGAY